ncbi:MFS transporter [Penicillium malachiteum]|uniref:MFS transporter n=1 Tax=Penicillium malachiteum TaxID=1324776 RepID=A0AAD6MV92_9EURO|nr:MFS transporter [Penicillium malachiteum]
MLEVSVNSDEASLRIEEKSEQFIVEPVTVDGGYGWICALAVFLINAHLGIFLTHYMDTDSLAGATTLNYAFIGGLQYSQSFMIAPIALRLMALCGTRTCLLTGVFIQTGSLIGASFATQIWHLYLGQGIGFGWGVGLFLVGTQNNISQWFTFHRSLAAGLAAAGTAIISGAVNFISSIMICDRNDQVHAIYKAWSLRYLRDPYYLVLLAFACTSMLGEIIILTQIPNFGSLKLGLSGTQASVIGAMIALGQIVGRICIGFLRDKIGRLNVASLVTFLAGLWSVVVWPQASSYGVLIFFSICIGAFAGSFWAIIGPVTTEVMGLQDLPTSLSMLFLALVIPTTFSPVIRMQVVTSSDGSYMGTQLFVGFMFIASSIFCWIIRS